MTASDGLIVTSAEALLLMVVTLSLLSSLQFLSYIFTRFLSIFVVLSQLLRHLKGMVDRLHVAVNENVGAAVISSCVRKL